MSERMQTTAGQVLAAIERERAAWDDLLGRVGEGRMLEPGPMGEWTFKDLVAHLNGWSDRRLDKLEAVAHGQPEPAPGWPAEFGDGDEDEQVEQINAWIYERNKDRLLTEVLEESREGYARLAAIVGMVPEEGLNDPARFPAEEGSTLGLDLVSGAFWGHLHQEHEPAIRAWLAKPPAPKGEPSVEL
ncbi:MAG: hypothetical protein AVDCRST_MAG59-163 [uncultured Thermomicrobiales bacterium]|uniref:Mycothiol-dependent maleylpyruvate isomerase metal-binding domain-containing protein n=1 Tax=uncultured Thermomicrobiales bacterium TaxID=1645740 RepID=A0A6J4TXZ6_9BACT|nr:MAG: hypothetical protein AVDCRST_MAG59-163 [uncultured Thermomicrobiales bacterium]